MIICGSIYLHDTGAQSRIIADPALLGTWTVTLAFIVLQLVLAWSQKPATVTPRQQAGLDQIYVTVVIPCYNEDPRILDRTIVSLFRQTRLPDHIEVIDDGSTVDYSAVRDFWLGQRLPSVRFTSVRQRNAGKKHAQAVTFTSDGSADIFVTIDSDSALDRHAISEGLKPFADPRVVSVAGLETAINIDRNLLTRAIGHRSLVFQLFAMSAQSVARGNVLINPGAFSLYQAPMIRKIVPSYLGETFFGFPSRSATTRPSPCTRCCTAVPCISPPRYRCRSIRVTLAHHLRQWTRWMRASTIRMLWRLRYLPVLSYGWIFTLYTIGSFLFSVAMTIAIPLAWPGSERLLLASLAAMVIWPLSIALRLATIRRSDQGAGSRLTGVALLPFAALWYVLVLRQIRFYGIATCWRQGWITRQHVEVTLDGSYEYAEAQPERRRVPARQRRSAACAGAAPRRPRRGTTRGAPRRGQRGSSSPRARTAAAGSPRHEPSARPVSSAPAGPQERPRSARLRHPRSPGQQPAEPPARPPPGGLRGPRSARITAGRPAEGAPPAPSMPPPPRHPVPPAAPGAGSVRATCPRQAGRLLAVRAATRMDPGRGHHAQPGGDVRRGGRFQPPARRSLRSRSASHAWRRVASRSPARGGPPGLGRA